MTTVNDPIIIQGFLYYRKSEGENEPDSGLNNC